MHTNINLLLGKIREQQHTQETLANAIGVDRGTLSKKMRRGGGHFRLDTVYAIIRELHLSKDEAIEVFFSVAPEK